MGFTRKSFAIELSKLEIFDNPKVNLEQYPTDSEVASDFLWNAAMKGDVEGKVIADFGCGTGLLGIGCLLLGARKVYFVDKDQDAIDIAMRNLDKVRKDYDLSAAETEFVKCDISEFNRKVDVVVMNPPFGVKNAHADKIFLETAFKSAPIVYSLHKTETKKFVDAVAKEHRYRISDEMVYDFPLKQTMKFHTRRIVRVKVSCFRIIQ